MVVTTSSTIYYASANRWKLQRLKVHFGAYMTSPWPWLLTFWPQNLTCSSFPRSPSVAKVWSHSVSKCYRANNVFFRDVRTHGRTNTPELRWRRHNKSCLITQAFVKHTSSTHQASSMCAWCVLHKCMAIAWQAKPLQSIHSNRCLMNAVCMPDKCWTGACRVSFMV